MVCVSELVVLSYVHMYIASSSSNEGTFWLYCRILDDELHSCGTDI